MEGETARANLIVNPMESTYDEDQSPPDSYNTNECTKQADLNNVIYYSYIPGSPKSILVIANTLLDFKKSDPKSYYRVLDYLLQFLIQIFGPEDVVAGWQQQWFR